LENIGQNKQRDGGLENTGDKETSKGGGMRNGGIGAHRGQRNKQGWWDEEWRDWSTQGTKKQAWGGGYEEWRD
jgi:hypothetical protein